MIKNQPPPAHHRLPWLALGLVALAGAQMPAMAQSPDAAVAKSIVDLQPFREVATNAIVAAGGIRGTATLVNLNPGINARYLLTVRWPDGSQSSYDLLNA